MALTTALREVRTPTGPGERADEIAAAVFSTWVVIGLFIDGWAHNAGKPETFWTPWHAVLYSGFLAGMAWFAVTDRRRRRQGVPVQPDPLALAGFALFAVGGLADMVWHTIFGIEKDLDALLSPSHLLLMTAGLLLVTGPIRSALRRAEAPEGWRQFAPAAVGLTLTVAVVAFFSQFASALHVVDPDVFDAGAVDGLQVVGVASILLASTLLTGALVWAHGRWPRPPFGTFTLIFGGTALLMSGLRAFDHAALVVPVAAAGALADTLVAGRRPIRLVATVVPVVMWTGWLAAYALLWGLRWPAELTSGTVVLAGLGGYGLSVLTPARPAPA